MWAESRPHSHIPALLYFAAVDTGHFHLNISDNLSVVCTVAGYLDVSFDLLVLWAKPNGLIIIEDRLLPVGGDSMRACREHHDLLVDTKREGEEGRSNKGSSQFRPSTTPNHLD